MRPIKLTEGVASCFFRGHFDRKDKQRMLNKRAEIRRIIPFKTEVSLTSALLNEPLGDLVAPVDDGQVE